MPAINFLESAARRKRSAPENWHAFRYEVLTDTAFLVTGAVCTEVYSRGPRKGKPKFPSREWVKVVLSQAEVDEEVARYERETGNCSTCFGTKAQWCGWSQELGHRYEYCRACGATGKATR